MNENGIQFDDLGSSLTYVRDTWILGYSLRKPSSPLMSMCACKGRLHSTRATTTERGGNPNRIRQAQWYVFGLFKDFHNSRIAVIYHSSGALFGPYNTDAVPRSEVLA